MTNFVKQQGEVLIEKITDLPSGMETQSVQKNDEGAFIISHSESGHHHVIPSDGVAVMERTNNVPEGMRIIHAIVDNTSCLKQDAHVPHESIPLPVGIYQFSIRREYNPFTDEARIVAD